MIKGNSGRATGRGLLPLFILTVGDIGDTHSFYWCAPVRWIHYPLLISLIKIISQRGRRREKRRRIRAGLITSDKWSCGSTLRGILWCFLHSSVANVSSSSQPRKKKRVTGNTSVATAEAEEDSHMHTPPSPLQLLGCGVGVDTSHKPPTPHPSPAFRSVLVGFRAASAGMGWIRATHSCAAVCSLLAYLCRGGGRMVEEGDPARGHLAVLRSDLSIKAFHINSTHACT